MYSMFRADIDNLCAIARRRLDLRQAKCARQQSVGIRHIVALRQQRQQQRTTFFFHHRNTYRTYCATKKSWRIPVELYVC